MNPANSCSFMCVNKMPKNRLRSVSTHAKIVDLYGIWTERVQHKDRFAIRGPPKAAL